LADGDGPILVVAGADYVNALRGDVEELGYRRGRSADITILSTSCQHEFAVRYTASVSGALCCTLGALNSRLLLALAGNAGDHRFVRRQMQAWIDHEFAEARRPVRARRPEADADIALRIRRMRASQPDLSPTRGLRRLRADGVACSQERFQVLWSGVVSRAMV
jgi:hypothetical protein